MLEEMQLGRGVYSAVVSQSWELVVVRFEELIVVFGNCYRMGLLMSKGELYTYCSAIVTPLA